MIKGVILDLDGTVYKGEEAVPGASRFVSFLRATDRRALFVTNRANRKPEAVSAQLQALGVPCDVGDVLTSAQATAKHLAPGRVFVVGEAALSDALEAAGFVVADTKADYVVVSFDRQFTYDKMATACRLIQQGAGFVATNPDKGLSTESGIVPGTGAIVASVEAATGVQPLVIGKPEPLIMTMGAERMELPADEVLAVGDNLATDIPAGRRAGMRTALILTGISTRADVRDSDTTPTWVVDNYPDLQHIVEKDGAV